MADFDRAVRFVFAHEGGYVNDPADTGGPTNLGVTLGTLRDALGKDRDADGWADGDFNHDGRIDAADMMLLSREEALAIYRARYWDAPGIGFIRDDRIAAKVFDLGVNAHPRVAIALLQRAIDHAAPPGVAHVKDDGQLGPKTLASLAACDPELVLAALASEQSSFYLRIIERSPEKARFKKGWLARARWIPGGRAAA